MSKAPRKAPVAARRTSQNRYPDGAFQGEFGAGYESDAIQFMNAMERWKRENRRPFPAWSDVLEVFKSLGYAKPAA